MGQDFHENVTKIPVVDDEFDNLRITSRFPEEAVYDVMTANSDTDCISLALRYQPDLILLDVVIPNMDEFETYR